MSVVRGKKCPQELYVTFPDFTQHPADCFMDQIVGMVQEFDGNPQSVIELICTNKREGGNDGYALFPEIVAVGKSVEQVAVRHVPVGKWP